MLIDHHHIGLVVGLHRHCGGHPPPLWWACTGVMVGLHRRCGVPHHRQAPPNLTTVDRIQGRWLASRLTLRGHLDQEMYLTRLLTKILLWHYCSQIRNTRRIAVCLFVCLCGVYFCHVWTIVDFIEMKTVEIRQTVFN